MAFIHQFSLSSSKLGSPFLPHCTIYHPPLHPKQQPKINNIKDKSTQINTSTTQQLHASNVPASLQYQTKPAVRTTMEEKRRCANYKPNIWNYDFVESLRSEYTGAAYQLHVQKLKEDLIHVFKHATYFSKLQILKSIEELGLSNMFEREIEEGLDIIKSNYMRSSVNLPKKDIQATALSFRLLRQHGHDVSQGIHAWTDFCKVLLMEAQWCNRGYTPSLEEYLRIALISSSGPLLSQTIFLFETQEIREELTNMWEQEEVDLVHYSSLIIRLCNDLATSAAELERGDTASSILCYMKETNASEDIARRHIKDLISNTWMKINGEFISQLKVLKTSANLVRNLARLSHFFYHDRDGFGVQDHETKKLIAQLLAEAL
ncbi:hypothetical protein Ancab_033671 [Ancistrocladus abbreviatus]